MNRRTVKCVNQESPFGLDELFFSTTDRKGVIRYGNEVFVRVSEFQRDELLGKAHSIIRHPDMPRGVFRLFWNLLGEGQPVAAFVKNRAKDGRFYWVMAFATPADNGYLSVRLKPSSEVFGIVQSVYQRVLEIEQDAADEGASKDEVAEIGLLSLSGEINKLGFADYPAFMKFAMTAEMRSRHEKLVDRASIGSNHPSDWNGSESDDSQAIIARLLQSNHNCEAALCDMLGTLSEVREASAGIHSIGQKMRNLSEDIGMVALNARVSADSGPLEVVSCALAETEKDNREIIGSISQLVDQLVASTDALAFSVSVAALQSEVSSSFLREVLSGTDENEAEDLHHIELLTKTMNQHTTDLIERLELANSWFVDLERQTDRLHRNAKAIRFVRVAGIKESVGLSEKHPFRELFGDVQTHIRQTLDCCGDLRESVNNARRRVAEIDESKAILDHALTDLRDQSKCLYA